MKLRIVILSFLIYLLIAPIRRGGITILGLYSFPLTVLIYSIVYFIFTYALLKMFKGTYTSWCVVLSILFGTSILDIPLRIFAFWGTYISFPEFLVRIASILLAYLCFSLKNKIAKISIASMLLFGSLWLSYFGLDMWLHKWNYGTYRPNIEEVLKTDLIFDTEVEDSKFYVDSVKDKYLILDFWSSSCRRCVALFPVVQSLHEYYKDNNDVCLISVFCRNNDETILKGKGTIENQDCNFPCVSMNIHDGTLKTIGVNSYPTVLIIRNNVIIYRGEIEEVKEYIDKRL
ncbi:hypothetical protein D0T50_06595 [Bacteroides sp. 214]|uniref:TlpA family protein disulfide reductase n=1 Tax=Bacteroides sp. 214 TaxID=2302935 RepID=UPI0013D1D7E0|nr:thioredoxin-like domain-containing protein [Bacteroides sp. 214]NDW12558.1 hypothetical protein [Bacteroides sp. 214]